MIMLRLRIEPGSNPFALGSSPGSSWVGSIRALKTLKLRARVRALQSYNFRLANTFCFMNASIWCFMLLRFIEQCSLSSRRGRTVGGRRQASRSRGEGRRSRCPGIWGCCACRRSTSEGCPSSGGTSGGRGEWETSFVLSLSSSGTFRQIQKRSRTSWSWFNSR